MKKILTLLLDGFGDNTHEEGNALKKAKMSVFNGLLEKYPHSLLEASGPAVGLTEGQAGNESVGYKTISSGQILKQRSSFVHDFVDIDSLATNSALKTTIEYVKKNKGTFHIVGLMSDAGINSNIDDIIKIIEYLKSQEVSLGIDFIADGKDVEPKSAIKYIEKLEATNVPILTVCGRYYAMDNEEKWDRTRIYYDLIRNGVGLKIKEIRLALKNCYIRNITDEFLPPMILEQDRNIKDEDAVLWCNYKEAGALEIMLALTNPSEVKDFQTRKTNAKFLMMYPVDSRINATVLINEENDTTNCLGNYLSRLELTQARIASTTSYDCVTYYFNGEKDIKLPKCNNYLIDLSDVDNNKKIEINCVGVTKQIIKSMEKDVDFILASIDAADVVGHTGNFSKTVEILEFIDRCLGKIIESAELNFYTVVITSPYGNIEYMIDEENKSLTTHTTNKVPFIITDAKIELKDGALTDVAPTILSYMDISIPESMKSSKVLIKD